MPAPDIYDRFFDLPPERQVVYGKVRATLGRELTPEEFEDFVRRHEEPR